MALDVQKIRLTDDHTLESASEVMSQLQFERRLPNGRDAYLQILLRNLGFRSEQDPGQDGTEYKQFVFQGQCLILGDARVGKTSLKKSLMGNPFDADEPGTKGVEMGLVDRKWRNQHSDTGLMFGSFARFRESVLYQGVMFGPAGIEVVIDEEVTSGLSAIAYFVFMLLRIGCISSIIWLLSTVSVTFSAFSFAVVSLGILLQFIPSEHPEGLKLALLFISPIRFLIGLGTAHLLAGLFRGIECQNLNSSFGISIFYNSQFIWVVHLLIVAMLVNGIFYDLFFILMRQLSEYICEGVESSVPGQAKFRNLEYLNAKTLLPRLIMLMIPVMGGFSFGCVIELSTNMTTLEYCHILHLTIIPVVYVIIIILSQALCALENLQGTSLILLLYSMYLIMENVYVHEIVTSFCPLTVYSVIFAGWAGHTLYKDWDITCMSFFINDTDNVRETQAACAFTVIFIEKVVLNFQKLRKALHTKFSSLKLKILDFSGDKEYYAYHHIFLRDQAIYIVVFNMANFADDNFRNVAAKIQRLCFWLESICSKAASKTPIFLVGTHRGHMVKTCLKSIDKYLRQNLLDSFSDELVRNEADKLLYFPIENSHGKNDREIQNLQRKIMSIAEEHKATIGCEIPFSWIKIQDAIINLRKNKKAKFCVTLDQFPISVGNFICSNWSKETLKYFHEKGLVMYVDAGQNSELSKWVLLKPEILIDIIIQLVTSLTDDEELEQHGFRRDWKLLHRTGMLTESLIRNILFRMKENAEAMKGFLEEYDIICPLFYNENHEKEVTHFVPSLLPLSDNGNTQVWQSDPTDKVFYVFFKRFLPEPLFYHLLARAHKRSMAELPQGQPVIYRDVGRFWLTPTQPYRLKHLKEENMIEVTFSCRSVFMHVHCTIK